MRRKERHVAIILPVHNSKKHLPAAVESILKNTKYPYWKLYIVESASTDGTAEWCDEIEKKHPDRIIVIHEKERRGITAAINVGIAHTSDEDIYLTQDDVILPELYGRDWLDEFVAVCDNEGDDVGIITTIRGGRKSGEDYIKGFHWFGTWSLYIPRETIAKVGVLDENFYPGPGDDIDYSYRVSKRGLRRLIINFWVDHHRRTEHMNDDIEFTKKKNAGYFRRKHELKPSWSEFEFNGEKLLLDDRSFEIGGTFNEKKEVEDIQYHKRIQKMLKLFKDDDIFIDVGAHIGFACLFLQKGTAICIEPTPETCKILKENCFHNHIGRKLKVLNGAAYDREVDYVIIERENPGLNYIQPFESEEELENIKKNLDKGKDKGVIVAERKTIVLDNFFKEMEGNLQILKIDTEGKDNEVIRGSMELIKKHRPVVIVENAQDMKQFFLDLNYKEGHVSINTIWYPEEKEEFVK